jgi:hypothetical protein
VPQVLRRARPGVVLAAKRLHWRSPKGHRRLLREIARELAAMDYTNHRGAPYLASCVKSMVEGPAALAIARAATLREAILRHTLGSQEEPYASKTLSEPRINRGEGNQ